MSCLAHTAVCRARCQSTGPIVSFFTMITRLAGRCPFLLLRRFVRGQSIQRTEDMERSPPDPFACGPVSRKKDVSGEYVMTEEERKETVDFWHTIQTTASKLDNEETVEEISVGTIRRDSENQPRYHGQYSESNTRLAIDHQRYNLLVASRAAAKKPEASTADFSESREQATSAQNEELNPETEVVDVNLFFPDRKEFDPSLKVVLGQYEFEAHDTWFDREPFHAKQNVPSHMPFDMDQKREVDMSIMDGLQLAKTSPIRSVQEIEDEIASIPEETSGLSDDEEQQAEGEEEEEEEKPESEKENGVSVAADEEGESPQMTGHEYVMKLRNGEIEPESESLKSAFDVVRVNALDSQGFNSFKGYVPDITQFRRSELLWNLKKSIIFCDSDILAINKPYGLIVQGKEHAEDTHAPVLSELLKEFSDLLLKEKILTEPKKLHIVHRLDKETTGVLVMAMSKDKADLMRKLFENHEVVKVYHAITKTTPNPLSGIIDIPIEEGMVYGRQRMVLRPELQEEYRRIASPRQQAKKAVTEYKVKSWQSNAAMVELKPRTGVKHQLRVHMGFGMRCPILGDHKYTYLDRIAPQKLSSDILTALNVRPSKVRNIPMHLCSKLMMIPGAGSEGRTIYLTAHTPAFFKKTLMRLKLKG